MLPEALLSRVALPSLPDSWDPAGKSATLAPASGRWSRGERGELQNSVLLRKVLRKSTAWVVPLEGRSCYHTHTYQDPLQQQVRVYWRTWVSLSALSPQKFWVKHHLPKAALQPEDPWVCQGSGGSIGQCFRGDRWGEIRNMAYPKFWKLLDGSTNRREGFPGGPIGKESACQCRTLRDSGLIPGRGGSHEGGNGNPLQYSCLENPTDRGAWWATVHGMAKCQTQLSTHTPQRDPCS